MWTTKFQSNQKMSILEQGLFSWSATSQTMVSNSLHCGQWGWCSRSFLNRLGLYVIPEHANQFPLIWSWLFEYSSRSNWWKHLNNLYLCSFSWWFLNLQLFRNCSKRPPNLCKSTIILLKILTEFLEFFKTFFLIRTGQSNECCQTNPFDAGKDKLPVVNHFH